MSKLRLLTMIIALPFVMLTMQGCEFAAGAVTGAAANEALDDD